MASSSCQVLNRSTIGLSPWSHAEHASRHRADSQGHAGSAPPPDASDAVRQSREGDVLYPGFMTRKFVNFGHWTKIANTRTRASEELVHRLVRRVSSAPRMVLDVACGLGVNAIDVVHSGVSGNNGGYHTNPLALEALPNESSS
jgi:hypothetical protein